MVGGMSEAAAKTPKTRAKVEADADVGQPFQAGAAEPVNALNGGDRGASSLVEQAPGRPVIALPAIGLRVLRGGAHVRCLEEGPESRQNRPGAPD